MLALARLPGRTRARLSLAIALATPAVSQCEFTIEDSTLEAHDHFGRSLSLSGDWLIVGAPVAGSSGQGVAVAFELVQGTWLLQQHFRPAQQLVVEEFGSSVHLQGDEVWVGAEKGAVGATRGGFVERYRLLGGAWTFQERIDCPSPRPGAFFGHALARDGDLLAVGAPNYLASGDVTRGRAFVYENIGGQWSLVDVIAPPAPGTEDFGRAVAIQGPLLFVGDPEGPGAPPASGASPGAVHVYERGPTGYARVDTVAGAAGSDDGLGRSIAVTSVFGSPLVAAGAPGANGGAGTVVLISESAAGWDVAGPPLDPPPGVASGASGRAVAFEGERVVAGAPFLHLSGVHPKGGGLVYEPTIAGDPTSWAHARTLVSSTGTDNGALGAALSTNAGRIALGEFQGIVGADRLGRATVLDCGSSGATQVCSGSPNVTGVGATLAFGGSTSVVTNDAWFDAADLPTSTFCVGLYGHRGAPFPFGGGQLCIELGAPGLTRFTPPVATGTAGTATLAIDLATLPTTATISSNSAWTFQCWYRDANPAGSNLSAALEVSFCP